MDKFTFKTADGVDVNLEKLSRAFPEVITETIGEDGKIKRVADFEKLKMLLGDSAAERPQEFYEFTWPGKNEAIFEAAKATTKTLRPCPEESKNWDTTQNLYIEGDNLEALKILQEAYLGKVKMIYIDPPYNTGKDFVYRDNFHKSAEEGKADETVLDEETDNNLFQNTESNGRFHSDWCSMIYPRLKLARDLLRDDGVIFISIDDNEVENLAKITSEIFGISNLISRVIVNRPSEIATELTIQKHEYCLVYAKNIQSISLCGNRKDTISRGTVGNIDQAMPIITFPKGLKCLNIPDGEYNESRQIQNSMENIEVISPFIVEQSRLKRPVQLRARWRSSNDMRNFFANNCRPTKAKINGIIEEIYFDGDRFMPYIKKSVREKISSICLDNKRGSTDLAHLDINYFDFPKSVSYISFLENLFSEKNDIILDFFSGSATTAHACMQLNAEDGGNRKFIMVQLPEVCAPDSEAAKAGYKNICEIGKERIRRAGEKIKAEHATTAPNLDIGFRVLKIDESIMKDVFYSPNETSQDLLSTLESNIKENRTDLDLLFACLVDWGVELSMPLKTEEIEGVEIHTMSDGDTPALIACFAQNIPETVVRKIAARHPLRAVFRDSSFADSPAKINLTEIFKTYSPETEIKVL